MTDPRPEGLTVYRLPRSHWHCGLWNMDWAAVRPAKLHETITAFLHSVQDGKSPHILLTGTPGIGKTHVGVGVYRVAAAVWGTELVTWLNVPAFCEDVKRSYGKDLDPWQDVESATRLVVLDDLFGRDLSNHEASQIAYRLIDTAYRNGAALLVTMNQEHTELAARLASHEISRLLAGASVQRMSADKDWRRK